MGFLMVHVITLERHSAMEINFVCNTDTSRCISWYFQTSLVGRLFLFVPSLTEGEYLLLVFPFTTLELDFRRETPMDQKRDTDSTCRKGFLGEFGHLIELSVQITGWC